MIQYTPAHQRALDDRLAQYPPNTAIIVYQVDDGPVKQWAIGAVDGVDDERTMRAHLERWKPEATFLGCAVRPAEIRREPS